MASKPHTDEVYRPKRAPKNPIKFQIQLNEEQKLAKQMLKRFDYDFCMREYEKIIKKFLYY